MPNLTYLDCLSHVSRRVVSLHYQLDDAMLCSLDADEQKLVFGSIERTWNYLDGFLTALRISCVLEQETYDYLFADLEDIIDSMHYDWTRNKLKPLEDYNAQTYTKIFYRQA